MTKIHLALHNLRPSLCHLMIMRLYMPLLHILHVPGVRSHTIRTRFVLNNSAILTSVPKHWQPRKKRNPNHFSASIHENLKLAKYILTLVKRMIYLMSLMIVIILANSTYIRYTYFIPQYFCKI